MHHVKVSCVLWTWLVLPAGVAVAETPVDFPASAAPYLAAYRWGAANKNGGAAANEAYARWLGRAVVWAEDFEPTERWDSLEGGGWQLGEWSRLQFCWNPAQGYQQFPAEKAWPGDEWVDFVGLDLYDDSWAADTYPLPPGATAAELDQRRRTVWEKVLLHGDHGLTFWRDFAEKHRKPFSIPEWGVDSRPDKHSGLDNPKFIEQMHAFITDPANRVFFHCYFDVQAPDGGHQLSPGLRGTEVTRFPDSSARFKSLFGSATEHRAE